MSLRRGRAAALNFNHGVLRNGSFRAGIELMVGMGIGIEYGQDELKRASAYRVNQDPADLLRH